MTNPDEQQTKAKDYRNAYNAALSRKVKIGDDELTSALNIITAGGQNTLLHLAAGVGNLPFVRRLLRLDHPGLVKATNAQGNTALHLAAQGGFSDVVNHLLEQAENGVNVCNKYNETALFKACESGDLYIVNQLFTACPSGLRQWTVDKRTCLSATINRGDSDLVKFILTLPDGKDLIQYKHGDTEGLIQAEYKLTDAKDLIPQEEESNHELKYKDGDTALHLAVGRNDVDIIRRLIKIKPQLCYSVNDKKETPLCVAAKQGHLEAVKELISCRPDAVEMPESLGMNVLHLAAQVSQVRIVDYLNEKVFLLELVNRGREEKAPQCAGQTDPAEKKDDFSEINEGAAPLQSGGKTDPAEKKDDFSEINEGDTPLHTAARNKNFNMVESLLRIRGINKFALNKEGKTALDIVRENTEYHESDKIISVLASYPPMRKPFM